MNTQFRINFRREAFSRERVEARRRAVGLGIWLTYFGALAVMLGLYGLNASELQARTRQLQRQIARQQALHQGGADWTPTPGEATLAQDWVGDLGRWRDLLVRLPGLLPEGARLTSLQFNPDGTAGTSRRLLVHGLLRLDSRHEGMSGVTDFVTTVARDSLFATHFKSVRLVSTRTVDGGESEFELECR